MRDAMAYNSERVGAGNSAVVVDLPRCGPILSLCTESCTDSWSPDGARNPWSAPTTELWAPTATDVLADLAADDNAVVRAAVAGNPACGNVLVLRAASDPAPEPRKAAAANRACPPTTLESLAEDPCLEVRHAVADNPSTPAGVLERLAEQPSTQTAALSNISCPQTVLAAAARNGPNRARRAVAGNPQFRRRSAC